MGHPTRLPLGGSPVIGAADQAALGEGEGAVLGAAAVVVALAARRRSAQEAGARQLAGTCGTAQPGGPLLPWSGCRRQIPAQQQQPPAHPKQAHWPAAGLGTVDVSRDTTESPAAVSVSQEDATSEPPATEASA